MPPAPRVAKAPVVRQVPKRPNAFAGMPQLAAMPTDLVGAGNAIADYLTKHRFSFPSRPDISVVPADQMAQLTATAPGLQANQRALGTVLPGGQVRLAQEMANLGVNGQSVTEVLHELLHATATGGNPAGGTQDQYMATEQATETMAQDLLPGIKHYLRIPPNSGGSLSYKPYVMAERYASAKATGTNWTSPQSRAWRANQFFTQPAQRQLINYPGASP